jgi:hypothetical protein
VSGERANWFVSHAARSATNRHSAKTKIDSPKPSYRWPANMGAMGTHPSDEDLSPGTPDRRITALLQRAGWRVGKDRVERISTPRTKTYPWGPRSGVAKG